jgi:hypothetical protein
MQRRSSSECWFSVTPLPGGVAWQRTVVGDSPAAAHAHLAARAPAAVQGLPTPPRFGFTWALFVG